MDRRQLLVQRAREYFGDRLEDVKHMVLQDRQGLRGWEEPAHVRAVARRAIQEVVGGEPEGGTALATTWTFAREAGEPNPGQQREAMGQLLEAGASSLDKVARGQADLSGEECLGLECVLLLYGRPGLLVSEGRLAGVPPYWNVLEDQREDVEMVQRGVGRIELLGHPEYDWAGTAFLVNETTLLTTRRTVELFAEPAHGTYQFRPGITAWMDYRSTPSLPTARYQIRRVIGMHDRYDLALLEVESPQLNGSSPVPLSLCGQQPPSLEGRPVYLVSYPIRDARRSEPEPITRIFRDVYNVKRVQPGVLRGCLSFREVQLLQHDCGPLGQNAGGCLVDLETHQVLGLQLCSRYLDTGTAVPLWVLRDDPLLRQAGVPFADTSSQDRQMVLEQIERLARSRYWREVKDTIGSLYQRAFGMPTLGRGQ